MINSSGDRFAAFLDALPSLAVALCLAASTMTSAAKALATIETLDECFFDEPDDVPPLSQECGYIVVPENPDIPDGPELKLAFLRLHANSTNPRAPFFMLAGGPGDTFIKP